MPDYLRRGIRTFLQAFIGSFALFGVPVLQDVVRAVTAGERYQFNYDVWQAAGLAVVAGTIISLVSTVQNGLEDTTNMPALIKAPPSSGNNPAP